MHGSSLGYPSASPSNYGSSYGSNQNLRGDYYGNAGGSDYRRSSNGTLKFPMTSMNTGSSAAYTSPYKDRYSSQGYLNGSGSSGYTSAYKDRSSAYYNPYTSFDTNAGITTAGLSFNLGNSSSSKSRDYPSIRSSNLLSTSTGGLSGSNTNLMNGSQSINDTVANIGRSQSLREHERKNRSRKYREAAKVAVPDTAVPYDYETPSASSLANAQKSLSSLSLHSEGYEVTFVCFAPRFDLN